MNATRTDGATALLHCPFCGRKPKMDVDNGKPPIRSYPYLVECQCGAMAPKRGVTYEEAAQHWNKRAEDPRVPKGGPVAPPPNPR